MKSEAMRMYGKSMPAGAGALYFIQLFATIGFAVLYSTLVLYATRGLHLKDSVATGLIATYVAFNYALHLLGGYIGGRFLSYRGLFCVGMLLQFLGCLFIAQVSLDSLYWGLALFLAGSGLNVTCINCMLTQLFEPEDKRRESAFLWNYSGMNIGFFVAFIVAGSFQIHDEYHKLFLITALGNLLAFILTLMYWNKLFDRKTAFSESPVWKKRMCWGLFLILILVLVLHVVMSRANLSSDLVMWLGGVMAVVIPILALLQRTPEARQKMFAYYILAWGNLIFWSLYQMIPMGLTLFIERNINRHLLGFVIQPQWVNNVNTLVIIVGGPIIAMALRRLRDDGRKVSIPFLFSVALLLTGLSMVVLPVGIHFANAAGYTSVFWIILCYFLLAVAELCISPIGYAMVGQLAPPKLSGVLMGSWMMLIGIGGTISNVFSNMALGKTNSQNPLITNASFSHTFNLLGWVAICVGIVLFFIIPFIYRLMHENPSI